MAKYDALRDYLDQTQANLVKMSFERIGRLVGGLPESAYEHRAWWSNDQYHVQAVAWQSSGFRVRQVDLDAQWVWFER